MTLTQVVQETFPGLSLGGEDVLGAHGSVDGLNCELGDGSFVRPRDQVEARVTLSGSTTGPGLFASIFRTSDTKQYWITSERRGSRLAVWTEAAGITRSLVANLTLTYSANKLVNVGTPGSQAVYVLSNLYPQVVTLPSTLSTPAATVVDAITGGTTTGSQMPPGKTGAFWEAQGRMVLCDTDVTTWGPTSLATTPDHVWFSEPGDPTRFRSDGFVVVGAGDGERVRAAVAWGEYLIVFKETKFFVFYGVSSSARGVPIFNYRPVTSGVGVQFADCASSGPDGVYFLAADGIYKTSGGAPSLVSGRVGRLWRGVLPASYQQGAFVTHPDFQEPSLTVVGRRVYLMANFGTMLPGGFVTGQVYRLLVGDLEYDWWQMWQPTAPAGAQFVVGQLRDRKGMARPVWQVAGGGGAVWAGPPIPTVTDVEDLSSAYYQAAYQDTGGDSKVRVRQLEVWGTGAVSVQTEADGVAVGAAQTPAFGTTGRALLRNALVGQRVGAKLTNLGGTSSPGFRVDRLVWHVASKRVASAL